MTRRPTRPTRRPTRAYARRSRYRSLRRVYVPLHLRAVVPLRMADQLARLARRTSSSDARGYPMRVAFDRGMGVLNCDGETHMQQHRKVDDVIADESRLFRFERELLQKLPAAGQFIGAGLIHVP